MIKNNSYENYFIKQYQILCHNIKNPINNKISIISFDIIQKVIENLQLLYNMITIYPSIMIPIIFMTGSDTPANIVNCYDLGAVQFLAKPVSSKTLISQVETTLDEFKKAVSAQEVKFAGDKIEIK